MKLLSLSLKNYRCFPKLEPPVDFHPGITLLAAVNGRGKSSILDAITVALSPYTGQFEHGDRKGFKRTDASLFRMTSDDSNQISFLGTEARFPVGVEMRMEFEKEVIEITRDMNGPKGRTTTKDAVALKNIASELSDRISSKEFAVQTTLPVISYYGTGRLHAQKRLMLKDSESEIHNPGSRTMGYLNCLSSESTYKHFAKWMKETTLARIQESDSEYLEGTPQAYKAMLDGVAKAVQHVLAGQQWSDLRYTVKEKELTVLENKARLPLASLSDGLRSIIAMVGDLAYRCIVLNPQLGEEAPSKTPGIVLIDEIEMHLHPAWQQKVIKQLMDAFPMIQFICTTHSPQVLSTVKQESIRLIAEDGTIQTGEELGVNTYGAQSYFILEDLMNVSPNPRVPEVENLKGELKKLLERSDLSLDHPDLKKLEQMVGFKDPFIRNLKASIIGKGKERA